MCRSFKSWRLHFNHFINVYYICLSNIKMNMNSRFSQMLHFRGSFAWLYLRATYPWAAADLLLSPAPLVHLDKHLVGCPELMTAVSVILLSHWILALMQDSLTWIEPIGFFTLPAVTWLTSCWEGRGCFFPPPVNWLPSAWVTMRQEVPTTCTDYWAGHWGKPFVFIFQTSQGDCWE